MASLDITFDEHDGGDRDPKNFLAVPRDSEFHLAMKEALPWEPGFASTRVKAPSAYFEGFLRKACKQNGRTIPREITFITRCLNVSDFLAPALQLMVEEGFLSEQAEEGEEGESTPIVYEDYDAASRAADTMVEELKDAPQMRWNEESFEWLDQFQDIALYESISWFAKFPIADLTEKTGDLTLYDQLNKMVGPRAKETDRVDPTSTFFAVIANGGQLTDAMKTFFYRRPPASVTVAPSFLLQRLPQFLLESQWPDPYQEDFQLMTEYAFDLPGRASWTVASAQEWPALVQNKLRGALRRGKLPTLAELLLDAMDDPAKLVRMTQGLGDMLLGGATSRKLPFWQIHEVESKLLKTHGAMITRMRQEEESTTEDILSTIEERDRALGSNIKDTKEGDEGCLGPKPGQVAKATAEPAYANLVVQYLPTLEQPGADNEKMLELIGACLAAETPLPKAVLFAAKGTRMAPYIGASGSDFLALLHDQRHMLPFFFGQSLAFDAVTNAVPKVLRTFAITQEESDHFCTAEWEKMDPFNNLVLPLLAADLGTVFAKHDVAKAYHHPDATQKIAEAMAKMYALLGYPESVTFVEGWSYPEFMKAIRRLQNYALGMEAEKQQIAFNMIDDFMRRATMAAAAKFKRYTYGASVAGRQLGPWVSAQEKVVIELRDLLDAVGETADLKRRMGDIFGKRPVAATLPGHALARAPRQVEGEEQRNKRKGNREPGQDRGKERKKGGKSPERATTNKKDGRKGDTPRNDKSSTGSKSLVDIKRIFPYADGTFSIGEQLPVNVSAARRRPARGSCMCAPPSSRPAMRCERRREGAMRA